MVRADGPARGLRKNLSSFLSPFAVFFRVPELSGRSTGTPSHDINCTWTVALMAPNIYVFKDATKVQSYILTANYEKLRFVDRSAAL